MSSNVRLDKRRLEQIMREHPQKLGVGIRALALEGQRIVQMSFNTSPPGRRYKRGTVIHIASQPGYPPNIDTGKLMNAISVQRRGSFNQAITTGDTEYAAMLEFGTTRMAARPFMRPMAAQLPDSVQGIFNRFLEH